MIWAVAKVLLPMLASPTSAYVVLPLPVVESISRAGWLVGVSPTLDVTDRPGWHGEFEVGATYRLRRGAYLYRLAMGSMQVGAPTRYGREALSEAGRRFGDARRAPPDFAFVDGEAMLVEQGSFPVAPVEGRAPDSPLPANATDSFPAGTRFMLKRVIVKQRGDYTSIFYDAEVLDGDHKGEICGLSGLSNWGGYGFETPGSGYSPNPLMLEKVATPPASQPATLGACSVRHADHGAVP
jgi:hypothetical protein